MSDPLVVGKLIGDESYTGELDVPDGVGFAIAVDGEFVGTITLQVATRWRDVEGSWTNIETYGETSLDMSWRNKGRILVRAGFLTGDFVSGEARVQLYRGEDDPAGYKYVTKKSF